MHHEIIVGNIGIVYVGEDRLIARKTFINYMEDSQKNYGRASGESVVWFVNGVIYQEHEPESI